MRRPIGTVPLRGCFGSGRDASPEDSTEESGLSIPIQRASEFAGSFYVLTCMEGNGARVLRAESRGVL